MNELLCFLNFHFGKVPQKELITTLNGFYSDEAVKDAKDLLFGTLDQMSPKPDGIPRFRPRTESTNRRRLDCGDIVNLFEFADKN